MALVRAPLRHGVGYWPGRRVCRACTARLFSSSMRASADEPQPRASSPTAQRPPLRRARERSAAAFAAIKDLQQKDAREPQAHEPSSLKGTVRMGSAYHPTRAAPNIGGLRYQPHNVAKQSSEQQTAALSRSPLRVRRTSVPPQSGSPRRDSPEALDEGARQNKPASRQRGGGPGRRTRQQQLPDEEEVDYDEGALAADEALDVTEEDLAASQVVKQKRIGALAASHGVPSNSYMRRRAAAIAARTEKYHKDEERYVFKARMRPASYSSRFRGKGSLKNTANRNSHSLRARAWPYMLALQRSGAEGMERLRDKEKSKWDLLVKNWVSGSYDVEKAGAKAQKSKAAVELGAVVNGYITTNSSYDLGQGKRLLDKLQSVGLAARL